MPGNITEEKKCMEQKVVFVAYQVQNLKLWSFFFLFLYLILELTSSC